MGAAGYSCKRQFVTPEMAAAWLRRSAQWAAAHPEYENRPLSMSRVQRWAAEMRAGQWKYVAVAIVLGAGGAIINGQHRLQAVVLSGVPCEFLVEIDSTQTTARNYPIDLAGSVRPAAWVAGVDKHIWEAASLIAALGVQREDATAFSCATLVDTGLTSAMANLIARAPHPLTTTCCRLLSQAPIRAMVHLAMFAYPERAEVMAQQYRAFVLEDLGQMWPVTQSFMLQLKNAALERRRMGRDEVLARAYAAFGDKSRQVTTKLSLRSMSKWQAEIRHQARSMVAACQQSRNG